MNGNINQKRYSKAVISPINIGLVTIRNPYIAMWWAAAFPGIPQIAMCKYLMGGILILWEFFINLNANFNLAIYYSFIGEFELATQVLDTRWILIYIPVYLFGIWDSRRGVMETNKFAILADSFGSAENITPTKLAWYDHNLLDKMRPRIAALWSFILPGLGHLYINRLPTAFYVIVWVVPSVYFSNLLPSMHMTLLGQFDKATEVLDPQWLLFLPSIYGFAIFDAYLFCIKSNELYKTQQAKYLKKSNQPKQFKSKLLSERGNEMNIVASFASSLYVELAINELTQSGISKENIFAIPLDQQPRKKNVDVITGEGIKTFEIAVSFATAFTVLGTIYGFIWTGGPVLWGLIGFAIGAILGLAFDFLIEKKEIMKKLKKGSGGEVMIVIQCEKENIKMVKDILFDHNTLGLSEVNINSTGDKQIDV
ncbi:hypothetical protein [Pontibacillus marinus]|uniref:Uncharacterized protein n=1 Tax=Pontibacillus marinus BH030004 = DSM 16465 TaxID=1385511 RepID=A0A0A5GAE0_9BACI|nr:hypothetical protein [Pontibacillus marinus]KGX90136.1 hypothetical protein N783_01200 [Pontibacillus marinus BH030004 = DSM 16465]